MTEDNDIYRAGNFTEEDYIRFKKILFSSSTPVEELEKICMILTHSPTKQAQQILTRFRESDRASEVQWLDKAVEEGQYGYLSPRNEKEKKDFLALQIIREMEWEVVKLEEKARASRENAARTEIKRLAVSNLVKTGVLEKEEETDLVEEHNRSLSMITDLNRDITKKKLIVNEIKNMIETERYKNIGPELLQDIFNSNE